MKNNGIISYADRKRIILKIERNNSMNNHNNNATKSDRLSNNKINQLIKTKRINSYKEPPNSINQEKEKIKDNSKLFNKVNLNNESLKNKTIKSIKNINSIPILKYIDININNNNKKLLNNK